MAGLELKQLRKSYGKVEVIKGVDLSIEHGEFVVFVGPSGCGKSTLLRMIAGLEDITGGELVIGDKVVNAVEPRDRGIAMVFQSYALYPNMTVRKNITFGLEIRGVSNQERDKAVADVAKLLQIEPLLDRKPSQLSGGQRQRVAMGRALVRDPDIFLFDEPLSNLDAKLRVDMRTEIKKLHQRLGSTIVYVTHDQIEAMTLADKIVVLNAGEIAQVGQPLHLYHYPKNRFVAGFLGSPQMNFVEVRAISASPEAVTIELPSGYPLTLPVDGSDVSPGDPLTLGIRPEHFVMPEEADFTFHGQIAVAERLGQYNLLYLTLERLQDVITLCVDGNLRVTEGETFAAGLKADKCHLFRENGEACTRHYREPAIYG